MNDTKEQIQAHQEMCNETRKKLKEFDLQGPCMNEPDRVEFKAYGLDCLLVRNQMMFQWCGYVGVKKNHPLYGQVYDDLDVDVHGGLTYSEYCRSSICHETEDEDNLYWFGFDCLHFQDFAPGMELSMTQIRKIEPELHKAFPMLEKIRENQMSAFNTGSTYRDLNYAMFEVKKLAEQLSERS